MTSIKIISSRVSDGSMKSIYTDDINKVNESRRDFLVSNKIKPENTTLVRVSYDGDDFKRYFTLDKDYLGDGITRSSTVACDSVVAVDPNHAILLPLADCIGAVIHDPAHDILMVSHLGRHSLEQFGGTASVQYLIDNFDVDPMDLNVWLSPAAGKKSYPLYAFENRSLHDVAIEQLVRAGIDSKNITASPIDTSLNEDYFSHSQFLKGYRLTDGRFAIVACIVND